MAKTYIDTVKYEVTATFKITGIVDKHDIVGAIFGQFEGLLGEELDLRELQKNGKIGRIKIVPTAHAGATTGKVIIPSSMDMAETSILAAALESVDKVGPCSANFRVTLIQDTRTLKREEIVDRAEELLKRLMNEQIPESGEISTRVRNMVRKSEITEYSAEKLPAGPAIRDSDSIIIVEGRADVITMLKNNIKNVIGMEGSKIPKTIVDLCREKTVTVFIDGDRGGSLNLRKLQDLAEVDYVAVAPTGKEVEELTRKEIIMALRKKTPAVQSEKRRGTKKAISGIPPKREIPRALARPAPKQLSRAPARAPVRSAVRAPMGAPVAREAPPIQAPSEEEKEKFRPVMESLKGTLKAKLLDETGKELVTVSVRDLLKSVKKESKAKAIVMDGIITNRLIETAEANNIEYLVGVKEGKIRKRSRKTKTIILRE